MQSKESKKERKQKEKGKETRKENDKVKRRRRVRVLRNSEHVNHCHFHVVSLTHEGELVQDMLPPRAASADLVPKVIT